MLATMQDKFLLYGVFACSLWSDRNLVIFDCTGKPDWIAGSIFF